MSSLNARVMSPSNSSGTENRSPQYPSGSSSLLLEKAAKLGLRRSTPDSEALASSDDEQDPARHLARITSQPLPKPTRRPSWINETSRTVNRKSSVGTPGLGLDNHSPAHTPDGNTWGSSGSPLARVGSNDNSYPWGSSSIWSNGSNSKAGPSRLAEMVPENSEIDSYDESLHSPGLRRDSNAGGSIPFAIPLKPTPKAYRSQSYSVGQMEHEIDAAQQARQSPGAFGSHGRAGASYSGLQHRGTRPVGEPPFSGIQHRSSRPSMMGDYGFDNPILEQLEEAEDDDDDDDENAAQFHVSSESRSQEQLERNALLRENSDLRQQIVNLSRSTHHGADEFTTADHLPRGYDGRRAVFSDSVLEEVGDLTDDAINAGHYVLPLASRGGRRMSEYNGNAVGSGGPTAYINNRHIENVKRNYWQSSLGFPGAGEQPQSRRHSFADASAPKRQVSIGSMNGDFSTALERANDRGFPSVSSFHGQQPRAIASSESNRQQFVNVPPHIVSASSAARFGHNPSFEHIPQAMPGPGRSNLYMVTFKASRAEFYYVPTGVGLEIKEGDLVIVEADRGTDLGTVVAADVPWNDTKKLREQQAEEHYRWLMMFSRRRAEGTLTAGNPASSTASNGGSNGLPAAAAPASAAAVPAPAASDHALGRKEENELKPKMIKRLAYQHEIQQLKEKEANEAKAKRLCQAKADEHGLDMEILDAEFQMDWKKLTFYYFADAYINFNSLVTDLFKTYKTRIWMSAINPASFQTPPSALAPPSIIGPGAILPNTSEHRQPSYALHGTPAVNFSSHHARGGYNGAQTSRGQGSINDLMQHQFWMANQGLGNSMPAPGFNYETQFSIQSQHGEDADFQRYGEGGGGRSSRDGQPSFAQHMASQQQNPQQHVHGQHTGIYGMRGPY